MHILECKSIKEKRLIELKKMIKDKLTLVVIQIGNFKENEIYLKNKKKMALELGIELIEIKYDENNTKDEIISKILELNSSKNVTGIMIQKPILKEFDYQELVNYINPLKDIDGVTNTNKINLEKNKLNAIVPCTAKGVLTLLKEYKITLDNKKIVVVGKSDLVGMPLYQILKNKYQILLCDSKTKNIKEKIREADIIITAIGKPLYFTEDYFRQNQVIIDVGTNYIDEKLVGDVDFNYVKKVVDMITPVPGGVGQLTTISLFENLVIIALQQRDNLL